jgi:hypothetical protein
VLWSFVLQLVHLIQHLEKKAKTIPAIPPLLGVFVCPVPGKPFYRTCHQGAASTRRVNGKTKTSLPA